MRGSMKPPGPSAGDPGTIFPGAKEISLFPCPGLPWASRPGTQETWPMWQCTLAPASLCCMLVPLVCQHAYGPLAHMWLVGKSNPRALVPSSSKPHLPVFNVAAGFTKQVMGAATLGCNGSPQSAHAYSLAAAPWGLGEAGNFPVHRGQKVPWAPLGPGGFIGTPARDMQV